MCSHASVTCRVRSLTAHPTPVTSEAVRTDEPSMRSMVSTPDDESSGKGSGTMSQSKPESSAANRRIEVSSCRRSTACSRSEEHTSELQSRFDLVCRLLLEKKKRYVIM